MFNILNRGGRSIRLSPFLAMVAFCFSMTVGVIWEFIEFICDQCFYLDMQKDFNVPNISSVTLDENNTQVPIHVTQITRTIIETEEGNTYAVNGEYLDIPRSVAQCLVELKAEQDEIKEALGNEYQDYNLVMATTFGLPIGDSYLRNKMQDIIDELGLPDVVFHSLRHTSVTYKLKLSGRDIKAVQGDSGHAQADMVTEVYGHIIDEDRRKNAEMMENAFYNKENLNPQMKGSEESGNTIAVPDGVDAELLMKVLGNPEMAALLTSLAKTMKV